MHLAKAALLIDFLVLLNESLRTFRIWMCQEFRLWEECFFKATFLFLQGPRTGANTLCFSFLNIGLTQRQSEPQKSHRLYQGIPM